MADFPLVHIDSSVIDKIKRIIDSRIEFNKDLFDLLSDPEAGDEDKILVLSRIIPHIENVKTHYNLPKLILTVRKAIENDIEKLYMLLQNRLKTYLAHKTQSSLDMLYFEAVIQEQEDMHNFSSATTKLRSSGFATS